MRIVNQLEDIEIPFKNTVITIGNFDGVHIGHQALLHTVIEKAHAMEGTAVAMTFEPHPMRVLSHKVHPPLITLIEQKTELIAKTGIDVLICIPFSKEFAAIPAPNFISDLLVGRIGMKAVVAGPDYTFGRKRQGNLTLLNQMAPDLDYEVLVVDWVQPANKGSQRISSTRIRELVMQGQMTAAKKLMSRYYQIRGQVSHGRNRGGRLLGFPTANINLQDELCPKQGIYAVTVELEGRTWQGVANIGYSPTFDDHIFTVEVHILDFSENIYGNIIKVNFIERLRDEIKFDGIASLSKQIRQDVENARRVLAGLL